MRRHAKRILQLCLVLLIMLFFSGVIVLAANRPRVRVIHAAPVVPSLDVYVSDILYFDNIFYTIVSEYAPVAAGDQTTKLRPAMSSTKDPSLVEVNAPFNEDQDYTLIVAGSLANLQNWRLEDDNELPGTGTANVRIVHASADTPSAEICLADVCNTLAFKENTGYFLMDPGTYQPQVHLNGTDPSLIKTPPLELQDNSVHTVFLVGKRHGQPSLELLYTFDAGDPVLNPHPPPPDLPGKGPIGNPPAPEYPPVSGAFLSPGLVAVLAGILLVTIGGVGFRLTRSKAKR